MGQHPARTGCRAVKSAGSFRQLNPNVQPLGRNYSCKRRKFSLPSREQLSTETIYPSETRAREGLGSNGCREPLSVRCSANAAFHSDRIRSHRDRCARPERQGIRGRSGREPRHNIRHRYRRKPQGEHQARHGPGRNDSVAAAQEPHRGSERIHQRTEHLARVPAAGDAGQHPGRDQGHLHQHPGQGSDHGLDRSGDRRSPYQHQPDHPTDQQRQHRGARQQLLCRQPVQPDSLRGYSPAR